MTALELYGLALQSQAGKGGLQWTQAFLGFLAAWIEDRRCPLELADWFEEKGMTRQSKAAKWMHKTKKRPVYFPHGDERDTDCHPYPAQFPGTRPYYQWYVLDAGTSRDHACDLPITLFGKLVNGKFPNYRWAEFGNEHDLRCTLAGILDFFGTRTPRNQKKEKRETAN